MASARGFSLVELLISIAIITVLLGVGVPAFRNYGQVAELNQAATDIQLALLQAHNLALAPETGKPAEIDYYGVAFTQDPQLRQSFTVVRGQKGTANIVTPSDLPNPDRHELPAGITVSPMPFTVYYKVGPTGGVIITPVSGNATVSVTSSRLAEGRNKATLTVNAVTGQVSLTKAGQ